MADESMVRAIVDLFSAGTETTSLSTTWAILFLVCYPEIQRELHKEIMQVIDNGRRPSLQDKPHLPYVQAFISDMMRVVNIAPTSVPHVTQDEVELCGYVIPKRTVCTANIYSVHMDPKEWPEPEEFRPERWINKAGPRACLGEQLARIEFFLFLTSMVQQYEFSAPTGTLGNHLTTSFTS
ncbi:cytochrome P450 2J3-like [Lingula anatina]|uniref:Cytochrome P450 2J3-like n=1 Tax=Lingula anatina TaxID=7574 RepID=A0A1S3H5L4_LINAN|nr:cytochrome P450 2J3-like [Lingula anatina]|eukprot:XP_013381430.2 cytochrome P450 2J3-like [Lingula anatina]